jgi:hypothetical protein
MPISGTIEQVPWSNYVYTDATTGDIIFRSITSNNFLFGFNQNVPSTFNIKSSGLFINGTSNTPANLNFYRAGQSNASLQVNDMTGMINFGGRYGASTMSNFASITSLYTGNGVSKSGNIIFSTECNAGMTERMRLTDIGNLGIGTPAPQGLVHMRTARRTPRQISFNSATTVNTWFDTSTLFTKYSSNPWFFETSNNIVCSVSFGTSTTATTRSMTSTYNSNGTWVTVPSDGTILPFWASTTQGGAITITELEDSAPIRITDKTNTINSLTVLSSNGFVGIGTSNPGSRLSVAGGQTIGTSYSNLAAPTNGMLVQGNVGIGTTSPVSTLDVNGTVSIAGNTFVDSSRNITPNGINMVVNARLPHAAMTSNSMTDGSIVYTLNSSFTSTAWRAFDWSIATGSNWEPSNGGYTSGTWNNSLSISTVISGTTYNGHWLQLQLNIATTLINMVIYPKDGLSFNPKDVHVAGSFNGSTWTLIRSFVNIGLQSGVYNTYSLNNTVPYTYYRLVFPTTMGSGNVAIGELYFTATSMNITNAAGHSAIYLAPYGFSNAYVGIGTSTPAQVLDVNGTTKTNSLIVTGLTGYMYANSTSAASVVTTIPSSAIANLDAGKITTGIFEIPSLDASIINAGTFATVFQV